jgi:hypothetical protein
MICKYVQRFSLTDAIRYGAVTFILDKSFVKYVTLLRDPYLSEVSRISKGLREQDF